MAEVATVVAAVGALGLWCSVPNTAALADDNPDTTAFIELRQASRVDAGGSLHWTWRPLGSISRYLRAAVIYAEDYNFYRHEGVDWHAIEHAALADWSKGRMAIGGSTITQQLAKNLYLSPRRSLVRKVREIWIASSLEQHLTKQRILELYLNVVEWGDGVFGAEAAAQHWFHHGAQSLTPAEAIRLAIALPNPVRRAPNVRSAALTKKAVRITRLLRMQGLLDASQERATLDALGAAHERVLPSRFDPSALPPDEPEPDDAEDAPRGATHRTDDARAPAAGDAHAPAAGDARAPAAGDARAPAAGDARAPAAGAAPAATAPTPPAPAAPGPAAPSDPSAPSVAPATPTPSPAADDAR